MVVRRRLLGVLRVVDLQVVVTLSGNDRRRPRSCTLRTQHGPRHGAPDGEQNGQQNQDEDAEVSHVGRLSGRWSAGAGAQQFDAIRLVPWIV